MPIDPREKTDAEKFADEEDRIVKDAATPGGGEPSRYAPGPHVERSQRFADQQLQKGEADRKAREAAGKNATTGDRIREIADDMDDEDDDD